MRVVTLIRIISIFLVCFVFGIFYIYPKMKSTSNISDSSLIFKVNVVDYMDNSIYPLTVNLDEFSIEDLEYTIKFGRLLHLCNHLDGYTIVSYSYNKNISDLDDSGLEFIGYLNELLDKE